MKRTFIPATLVILLVASCTSDPEPVAHPWDERQVDSAPWTIKVPPGWEIATEVFEPRPRDRVGMVTTAVSNVDYQPDAHAPSPNGRGGASSLGDDAVVVLARLLWDPDQDDPWDPRSSNLRSRPPSKWHDDAQNPGWRFRERKLCLGSSCVSVLEWYAPDATVEQLNWMEQVASAVELAAE